MAVCSIGVSDVNSIPERVFSSAFKIFDQVTRYVGGSLLSVFKGRGWSPFTSWDSHCTQHLSPYSRATGAGETRSPKIFSSPDQIFSPLDKCRSWSKQSFTQWTGKRTATSERRILSPGFALPPRSASPCTGKSSSSPVSWLLASFSTRFKFQPAQESSDAFLKGGKAVRTCAGYRRVRWTHRDMSHLSNRQKLLTSASKYSMLVSPIH